MIILCFSQRYNEWNRCKKTIFVRHKLQEHEPMRILVSYLICECDVIVYSKRENKLYKEKQKDSINLINTCKVAIFAKK